MNFSKDEIVIKSLTNTLKTNKLSHAYLVIGEDSLYSDEFILRFVKAIFCLENKNKEFFSCERCNNCRSINHGNYVDFYKLTSDTSIKKDEIQTLKSDLSVKSFYGKKIYWIKDIEKMTEQAANSLLKFLEEPEDDIIAILSCKNISAVLPTIISRCQQIKLVGQSEDREVTENEEMIKIVSEYVKRYSRKPHMANIYVLGLLKVKEEILDFFKYLSIKTTNSYYESNRYDIVNISKVQEKVLLALSDLNANVNATLVLEKFLFTVLLDKINLEFLLRG
ncbi:MAG: DNA polymerase III subunit delta' [Gemella haemolysans]|uniref:DNA polymerase III subunit delta' n=1 Tax=Gemella haemolysans TaxID=1379 RepID=UPI00290E1E73|nr:DNA polymerase III subunit delta' [Gemella haemolysans]MDU4714472.1 DNA polymerase III subunit delta' [Gemella haemolysans]